MKILLRPCEYGSYYLDTFSETEELIKFLKENCYDNLKELIRRAYAVLGGLFATGYHIANGLGSGKPFFSYKNS